MIGRFSAGALSACAVILMIGASAMAQLVDPFSSRSKTERVQPIAYAVAWSPDGRFVAHGYGKPLYSKGRVGVVIRDAATGKRVRILWHDDGVRGVAWSPDSRYLATGAGLNVHIWDTASGKVVRSLSGSRKLVLSVAWSPDGRFIASGSYGKPVRVWDAGNGKAVHTLTGHTKGVSSVAWSPDGRLLVSGSHDNTVRVWNRGSGRTVIALRHGSHVYSVAWSPDGRFLATGSHDKTAIIWNAADGRSVRTLRHDSIVRGLAWSPDGRFLATASAGKAVRIWEAATGRVVRKMSSRKVAFEMAWSPDGTALVIPGQTTVDVLERSPRAGAPAQGDRTGQYAALARSGQERIRKRDYAGAEADLTKALANSPPKSARADLHYARAYARYLQRRTDRAVKDLDAALRLKPDVRAYGLRGRIRLEQRNYAGAKADFGRALKVGPPSAAGRAEAHFLRARAETGLGNRDAAVKDMTAAIGLAPRAEIYFERANLYRVAGAMEKALSDFGTVLRDKRAPAVLRTRAHLGSALVHHARRNVKRAMANYDAFFAGISAADKQTRAFGALIVQRLGKAGLYSGDGKKYDMLLRGALARCVAAPECVF